MATPELYVLHVSPWSERVRWALDHHGIGYREIQHVPLLGERRLRKLVGTTASPVTVPVLVVDGTVYPQSWDIVAYADREGDSTALVPTDKAQEIREWVRVVDEASEHGRALVVREILRSPAALDESNPAQVPALVRPLLRPFTRLGTRWFARKHGLVLEAVEEHEAALRSALVRLRSGLRHGRYLLGSFTYADVVAATLMQGIAPVADEYLRIGPATRSAWTRSNLASEYVDLLRWRDELYREHRRHRRQRASASSS